MVKNYAFWWNSIGKYVAFLLLGGLLYYFFFGGDDIDVDIRAYELKIELLEKKIDSIQSQNSALRLEADSLYGRIDTYNGEIQKLKVRINVVKKQTQAQLDAVNNFGNDELERFFSERYQRQPDSIN